MTAMQLLRDNITLLTEVKEAESTDALKLAIDRAVGAEVAAAAASCRGVRAEADATDGAEPPDLLRQQLGSLAT